MKFFFSRIFPLIFVVVGASVAFLGIRGLIRAKASVDWPSTQGNIVESSVERHRSSGSKGSSTTYHAEILYEFTVAGTTFNGDRVAYGDYGSSSSSHARRIVNRYPKGKSVTVHYMPGNPEQCLLEPGLKGQSWFLPGFGLIFFTVGSLMAVFLPKAIRKQEIAEH
ncbi:DUF3592 domain-containing protein [Verrucomicrobiota bacterium]